MAKYRKKPIVIEAVEYIGQKPEEILLELGGTRGLWTNAEGNLCIKTPEGIMTANKGDYIIKGIKGELYPCKPDIFQKSYDPA